MGLVEDQAKRITVRPRGKTRLMRALNLTHLSDPALKREMHSVVSRERGVTAEVLAYIAEFDARRLYLADGYPSMFAYCVHEMHYCEEAAYKRIRAARMARRFPEIFMAVADGRLHLSAVVLLAHHLTEETADELMAAAAGKTKSEIEQMLAERFPKPDLPTRLQAIALPPSPAPAIELSPGTVVAEEQHAPGRVEKQRDPISVEAPCQLSPGTVPLPGPRPKVTPLSPRRYALQLTIGQSTHDKLRYAQELLRHQIPSGDVAEVLDRALAALVEKLEKHKFAATEKPRPGPRHSSSNVRHIPAHVKRAVWQRDQGQCTYVSENGQRCRSRGFLEFDHIDPVARGGQATVDGMRLRCRGHNQLEAEQVFGPEFMRHKREEAQRSAAEARARTWEAGQGRVRHATTRRFPVARPLGA